MVAGAESGKTHTLANRRERFTKNLWTERTSVAKPQLVSVRDEAVQARFIVERILENRNSGTHFKEQAVLFRTSSHGEIEPTRRNIPVVNFRGLKFLDAAHKDMLALLRFLENPRARVAGWMARRMLPENSRRTLYVDNLVDCCAAM